MTPAGKTMWRITTTNFNRMNRKSIQTLKTTSRRYSILSTVNSWHSVHSSSPANLRQSLSQCRRLATCSTKEQPNEDCHKTSRPLEGIIVVSLEQAIAAPYCTRQLADLGARVIKVERPGAGDFARHYDTRVNGMSSHFVWTNRSKESMVLDLKVDRELLVLKKLIKRADVFVQNLAPGATQRLGLSFEALREENPSLIVCDISGYGQDGPYREKKAYDLLIQSESGILSVTGNENQPAKVGISIADIAAGMYAYSNILSALIQRTKTGKGCKIDISMLESMVEWMGFPLYYTFENAPAPRLTGASHATIFPYGSFETGDGLSVMLGIQNEREWANFCEKVLSAPTVAKDPRFVNNSLRVKHRDELKQIILQKFSTLTATEVVARLDTAVIANAKVNDMQGVWNHPQLQARSRWSQVVTPEGIVPALLPPGSSHVSAAEGYEAQMGAVPALGEHTEQILKELGI